jgi:hypothetical protein
MKLTAAKPQKGKKSIDKKHETISITTQRTLKDGISVTKQL